MNCSNCGASVNDVAKFCQECGQRIERITAPSRRPGIADSVISHSPGANSTIGTTVNIAPKEPKTLCPSCGNEINKENRLLKCVSLDCKVVFCEFCEGHYRTERRKGEKPLCEKCFESKQGLQKPTLTDKTDEDTPPFSIGEPEFDYIDFFNDVRQMISPEVPTPFDPDGHLWYEVPIRITGAHFEFYFELYKWRRLGVELHFQSSDRRWNLKMLSEVVKYQKLIEHEAKERVYVQRDWQHGWARVYLANPRIEDVENLKRWAAEKMKIFYKILQPKLQEVAQKRL